MFSSNYLTSTMHSGVSCVLSASESKLSTCEVFLNVTVFIKGRYIAVQTEWNDSDLSFFGKTTAFVFKNNEKNKNKIQKKPS